MSLPRPATSTSPIAVSDISRILPWVMLTVLGGLLLLQVFLYGSNLPSIDEWYDIVPVLTHQHPISSHWLWSSFNGHRIPLPRLVLMGALSVGHGNFRVGCFLNALILIVAVAILMRGLNRRPDGSGRGLVWTDALLPILLLNWGMQSDVLWPFELVFTLPVLIVFSMLSIVFQSASTLSRRNTILLIIALMSLSLCGLSSLIFMPAIILWLAATPFFRSEMVSASKTAKIPPYRSVSQPVLWSLLSLPTAVFLLYFVNLSHDNRVSIPHDNRHVASTFGRLINASLAFLQSGWGICAVDRTARPFSISWIAGIIPLIVLIGFLVSYSWSSLIRVTKSGEGDDLRKNKCLQVGIIAAVSAAILILSIVLTPRIAIEISLITMLSFAPLLLIMSGMTLLLRWQDRSVERYQTAGVIAIYISALVLMLGIAFARGGAEVELGSPHYAVLAALVIGIAYFVLRLSDRPANRWIQVVLFFWVVMLLPVNINRSRQGQTDRKTRINEFNSDMAAGVPAPILIGKNLGGLLWRNISPEQYEIDLMAMHAANVDHFNQLNDYPDLAMLFRNSVPLTGEDSGVVMLPTPLPNRIGSVTSWHFSPSLPEAMAYLRVTEVTSPKLSASTVSIGTLAEYDVLWHRSGAGKSGNDGGDSAIVKMQPATLYYPNPHIVEKVHDSVFYVPYNVDGISIVCTSQGTPLTVTKISVVPVPTGARNVTGRVP